ncbi:MAG: NUDIX hydrolase [Candidatus Levyibacteriota bacterium]
MITCQFEDRGFAKLRHVTVGTLVVNDKQEILLVKRTSSHRHGTYTIPGGFLGRDEDTQSAALRELKEETGYQGEIVGLFMVNDRPDRPKEDRQNVDFLFAAKIIGGEPNLNDEVSEIHWFKLDSLPAENEFAFDHRGIILKYAEHLKHPLQTPIMG